MEEVVSEIRFWWIVRRLEIDLDSDLTNSRFAFMSGTGLVIIGFSFASQKGCRHISSNHASRILITNAGTAPSTLCLILFGLGLLILGAFYELRTQRDALFPSLLFKDLSCGEIIQICDYSLLIT
jgi:hypothetical protein